MKKMKIGKSFAAAAMAVSMMMGTVPAHAATKQYVIAKADSRFIYKQAPNARDFSHEIQAPFFRMQKTEDFLILYNTGRERRCQDYAYAQTEA